MQKNSTPLNWEQSSGQQLKMKPKKSTVDLIKQFARIYSFSGLMPAGLGAFIAN